MKNLTHRKNLESYYNIIQVQIKEGIVDEVDEVCEREIVEGEKEFSLAH